jgi:hypothetical protein
VPIKLKRRKVERPVWIVIEEDRGCGISIIGVYLSEAEARQIARGARAWVEESVLVFPYELPGIQDVEVV